MLRTRSPRTAALLVDRGDFAGASGFAQRALDAVAKDDPVRRYALQPLGEVALFEGRLDEAVELFTAVSNRLADASRPAWPVRHSTSTGAGTSAGQSPAVRISPMTAAARGDRWASQLTPPESRTTLIRLGDRRFGEVMNEPFRVLDICGARFADFLDQLSEVGVGGCLEFPPVQLFADRTLVSGVVGSFVAELSAATVMRCRSRSTRSSTDRGGAGRCHGSEPGRYGHRSAHRGQEHAGRADHRPHRRVGYGPTHQVELGTIGWVEVFHDPDGLEIHLYSRQRHVLTAAWTTSCRREGRKACGATKRPGGGRPYVQVRSDQSSRR
ncbi:MAG: tetratricopeptide repeat protein [Pseudonocardiaceae bacterium]